MDKNKIAEYLKSLFDKYKYVLLICLVGLALASMPSGKNEDAPAPQPNSDSIRDLERKLEDILADMDGVGRVKVVLTAKSSSESVYAYNEDKNMSYSDSGKSSDSRSVLASSGASGSQQPVMIRTNEPEYRGALVVCDGAASSKIRLEITQAVASLTGISTDNIVISKMK